jgi:hypothetical protein
MMTKIEEILERHKTGDTTIGDVDYLINRIFALEKVVDAVREYSKVHRNWRTSDEYEKLKDALKELDGE